MKQPTKGWKSTAVIAIVASICLIAVFWLFHKPSVQIYHTTNPSSFDVIVNYFTENPLERPVSVHRDNVLRYGWSDVCADGLQLPQEIKDAIEDILLFSDCKDIYISMWDEELDYCAFTTSGEKIKSGIAFLPTSSKEQKLLSMRLVRECIPISDNWVYYEVYTPLGEKDFQY